MSGESVVLAGDRFVIRALRALGSLPAEFPDHALVGGLAVMIRLGDAHRVTGDIDVVSTDESKAIEVLVARDATRTGNGVRLGSGIDLDLIDAAGPEIEVASASDDVEREAVERQIAFAHALGSATRVAVSTVVSGQGLHTFAIRVVTAASLVVLKCHSTTDSRRHRAKRGSDVYDLVRLLSKYGTGAVSRSLVDAPATLRDSTARHARRILLDEPDRTAALVRASTVRGVESVAPEQLELLGGALVAELEQLP